MDYSQQQLDGLRAYANSMEELVDTIALHDDSGEYLAQKSAVMQYRADQIYKGQISSNYSEIVYFGLWLKYEFIIEKKREKLRYWAVALGIVCFFIAATREEMGHPLFIESVAIIAMLFFFGIAFFNKIFPCSKLKLDRINEIKNINAIYQIPDSPQSSPQRTTTFNVPPQS